ncbi:MAG: DUF2156 domain-containing protein [Desulfopila sp.]
MNTIPPYPESCPLTLELRPPLHERLRTLPDGVSEFTFANLYLFRARHNYRLSRLPGDLLVILGRDADTLFFMLPFGLPEPDSLSRLFTDHGRIKCVTEEQKPLFLQAGYTVSEDRDNFDYLYQRSDLAELKGRRYHKKRNLVKSFISNYEYTARPLLNQHIPAALEILTQWHKENGAPADYEAAREALLLTRQLQLCGGIYFVDGQPAGYTLGEELANGTSFVIHFEKAIIAYRGIYQFINQSFAQVLPEVYQTINREQDLGDAGLRQAKHSYQPVGFIRKYQVTP